MRVTKIGVGVVMCVLGAAGCSVASEEVGEQSSALELPDRSIGAEVTGDVESGQGLDVFYDFDAVYPPKGVKPAVTSFPSTLYVICGGKGRIRTVDTFVGATSFFVPSGTSYVKASYTGDLAGCTGGIGIVPRGGAGPDLGLFPLAIWFELPPEPEALRSVSWKKPTNPP